MTDDLKPNHYGFLERNFDLVLQRMGLEHLQSHKGNFSASGDKYYQYRCIWEREGVPWYHGAVMYHLMDLAYPDEVRRTTTGWVDPYRWVIDNYAHGHNLAQYMTDLS